MIHGSGNRGGSRAQEIIKTDNTPITLSKEAEHALRSTSNGSCEPCQVALHQQQRNARQGMRRCLSPSVLTNTQAHTRTHTRTPQTGRARSVGAVSLHRARSHTAPTLSSVLTSSLPCEVIQHPQQRHGSGNRGDSSSRSSSTSNTPAPWARVRQF